MPVGLLGDVVEMSVKRHDVLVDIFDARMFVAAFSAPRLSPRGGATIALPFHGMISVYRLLNPCINESAGFIHW